MSEEIKIDRLKRIMEVAKMLHDDLSDRTLLRLARQASDIYATAKEENEARSMLKEEAVKSPIEDEKDKEIERLKSELEQAHHVLNSIFDMAKRNNGVVHFSNDDTVWQISTDANDNNVGSMK